MNLHWLEHIKNSVLAEVLLEPPCVRKPSSFIFAHLLYCVQVIQGKVVMAKNPCLHPGDIRVLEAVDVPALHHMVDCLVVPQTGERPHPNEASGSDLDGDLYFTCWDKTLIPPSGSWTPMDYSPHETRDLNRPVRIQVILMKLNTQHRFGNCSSQSM